MTDYMTYHINKNVDCDDTEELDVSLLINKLGSMNGFTRMHARKTLICIGKSAVPELLKALSGDDSQLRWQVIKVLEGILDPSAVPAIVACLEDDNAGVRWAAAETLVKYKRSSIPALLEALKRNADSIWLRRGAHHVFHLLDNGGKLNQAEKRVYEALEDLEPTMTVPWAAENALALIRRKNSPAS